MLSKRLFSSTILILFLIGAIFWFPKSIVAIVIAIIIGLGLWEFYGLAEIKGFRPFKGYGTFCGILFAVFVYVMVALHKPQADEFIYMLLFLMIATILVKYTFIKDNSAPIINGSITILGIMYVSFLFTFIIKLRYLPDAAHGKWWVLALFIITKISDSAAYLGGTKWGRHKLIPRISAKKTIEGSAFGVLGAVIASLVCRLFFIQELGWIKIIILGILLSIAGQIGDLVESLIKRDAEVKDSGTPIPGMGGILDILDSLLFAGPVMYIYLKLVL